MTSLSRLEKLGTIFTRVRDLMRAGVMKEADKPVWFDVMERFPPRDEPTFSRESNHEFLPEILYEEDAVRSKFYKVYGNFITIDLTKHENVKYSPCHRFITKYYELKSASDKKLPEEIFQATAVALAEEGLVLRSLGETTRRRKERASVESAGKPATRGLALLLKQALEDQGIKSAAQTLSGTEEETPTPTSPSNSDINR